MFILDPLALSFQFHRSLRLLVAFHYLMALADVLPKVLAHAPADLQCLSSLRGANRYAKERVEAAWWTEQVQMGFDLNSGIPQRR